MGTDPMATETIQCHHNYTEQMPAEMLGPWKLPKGRHGHVWLSRKGAIDATEGRPGLIPGSMGTASYVVTGRGDRLSLSSSPHGAGREYSRSAARKAFTRADLDAAMEGIEWGRSDAFLDEIPGAYKPVDRVMADAADLVKVEHTLRQIVNVKGDRPVAWLRAEGHCVSDGTAALSHQHRWMVLETLAKGRLMPAEAMRFKISGLCSINKR
jgi:tRNA-splicing ligase RtcB